MVGFRAGEGQWIRRLGNLRNTIRQEMMRRQLADHVSDGLDVLDVGSGQGTQAIELAVSGCVVTGVEPSEALRELCVRNSVERGVDIEVIAGAIEDLGGLLGARTFDLVCLHGVLMYVEDRSMALETLASFVRPRGLLSVTFRNGHALAMRPGMRRDWTAALRAFDGDEYTNELGVTARADRLDEVTRELGTFGLEVIDWYGVRVFNDAIGSEVEVPDDEDLDALLDAEDQAGRLDPYRWFGSQLHVVARRSE